MIQELLKSVLSSFSGGDGLYEASHRFHPFALILKKYPVPLATFTKDTENAEHE